MKKIFLFSVSIIILFSSCKKDVLNTTVSGVVSNKKTGQLLANANVVLLELKVWDEFMGRIDKPDTFSVQNSLSNSNGDFTFNYKSGKSTKLKNGWFGTSDLIYRVFIKNDGYYNWVEDVYNAGTRKKNFFSKERNFFLLAQLTPHTFIKYKYKNTSPFNDDDLLYLMNGEEIVGKNANGTTSSILCNLIAGNSDLSNYKISWSVKKNGLINNFEKTINCAIGDTTLIEINY